MWNCLMFFIAAMRHESYFLMKDTVENLGPVVLDVLSEPLGAYMYHAHQRELSNTEDPLWKDYPTWLRTTETVDLGAGIC